MQDLTIGRTVRDARVAAGLSQQVLATRAGIALRTLSRIEAGEDLTLSTLTAVANALGRSAADLLARAPEGDAA